MNNGAPNPARVALEEIEKGFRERADAVHAEYAQVSRKSEAGDDEAAKRAGELLKSLTKLRAAERDFTSVLAQVREQERTVENAAATAQLEQDWAEIRALIAALIQSARKADAGLAAAAKAIGNMESVVSQLGRFEHVHHVSREAIAPNHSVADAVAAAGNARLAYLVTAPRPATFTAQLTDILMAYPALKPTGR